MIRIVKRLGCHVILAVLSRAELFDFTQAIKELTTRCALQPAAHYANYL